MPDSPYFIGFYLCPPNTDEVEQPYKGHHYEKTGRYVCVDHPAEGAVAVSEVDLGDDYDDRSSLSAEEQLEMDRMQHRMAEAVIRSWKINRTLYQQYGGRVIYQQMGPEPLDAFLAFLREAQESGRFSIHDPELEASFWNFFEDEQRHTFMPEGSDDEGRAFTMPPWAGD